MGEGSVKKTLIFGFMIAGLAGCAEPQPAPPPQVSKPSPPIAYNRPPPAQITPRPVSKPAAPQYKPMSNDTCGANALGYLIGKPRTEIPVPLTPATRRVVCSTCISTQEYRADRQTIVFDSDTGLIKSVTCG
jgi:hypothetical protein